MSYTTNPADNEIISNLPGDIRAVTASVTAHTGAASAAHAASSISVAATGNIASTDVQAALVELAAEKLDKNGGTVSGATMFSGTASFTGTVTASNTVTMSGAALNEAQGTNIASASTTNIGAASGNFVQVTGTTAILSFGSAQAGARRIVQFGGTLTLTHNDYSLILPGAINIITAAGDVAEFVSLGNGNWVCTNYQVALAAVAPTPIGSIIQYAGSSVPHGYLLCDGSAVSRTAYAALYAVLGSTYGAGDGSTTFNIPSLCDKFPLGKGSTYAALAATGGETTHILTMNEMPEHRHLNGEGDDNIKNNVYDSSSVDMPGLSTNAIHRIEYTLTSGNTQGYTSRVGGGVAHNNIPPYIVLNYIIRT